MRLLMVNFMIVVNVVWFGKSDYRMIRDLTDECIEGHTLEIYLTSELESSDFSVDLIASDQPLDCTLLYHVKKDNYVLIVIEFIDWRPGEKVCGSDENAIIVMSSSERTEVCREVDSHLRKLYSQIAINNIGILINSTGGLNSIKITATAMRSASNEKCASFLEIECVYNYNVYCMSALTQCDGNPNCGSHTMYDEDAYDCGGPHLTFFVVIMTMVMIIIGVLLLIALAVVLMPKRREAFVYKFNENMSVYDTQEKGVNFEISVKVVFPEETKNNPQKDALLVSTKSKKS